MNTATLVACGLVALVVMSAQATPVHPALKKLVASSDKFALDLYKQLAKKTDGNVFFSPLSISTALAMTYLGSKGKTAEQMAKILHFHDLSGPTLHKTFAGLSETTTTNITSQRSNTLSIANAIFVQANYQLMKTYVNHLNEYYGSEVETVDFHHKKAASKTINTFVEKETRDKIKDIIREDMLNDLTRLVLVNAIYFKGVWKSQFLPKDTKDAKFYRKEGNTVNVKMMFREGVFNMVTDEDLDCRVLELPYKGEDLSMLIILPAKKDGLAQVEAAINMKMLEAWGKKFVPLKVEVQLPKFKLEYSVSLADHLKKMGMSELFNQTHADLSGMTASKGLYLSEVVHKAFIEVNEEGTEAAAATGLQMALMMMPPTFKADHPFLFLIRHNKSGAILFMGRVADPTGSK